MGTNHWSSGPSLLRARQNHGCFSIKDNNVVTHIVVMGGAGYLSSSEILDVNTMTWATGPPLPVPVNVNRGVESVDGTYLGFSTGGNGRHGNRVLRESKILGLKKTSENVYFWEEVHSMTTARNTHSIVNAPNSLLPNC